MHGDRPSGTALAIALALISLNRRRGGDSLVSSGDAEILRSALVDLGGGARLLARVAGCGAARLPVRILEWATVPDILLHFALRKRLIEQAVRRAVTEGCSQVVVLGAGLDLLALRLSREGLALRLIEIDHPATQSAKRSLLAGIQTSLSDITLVPADLATETPAAALRRSGAFDERQSTVFVVEGLTMYLTGSQVRSLLAGLVTTSGSSRLVFTFMEPDPLGRTRFVRQSALLRAFLSLSGEPFAWGTPAASLPEFLGPCGWRLRALLGAAEFENRARELQAPFQSRQFVGEFVAEADRVR
jgi:methyltransferase (TIGR00027 family)